MNMLLTTRSACLSPHNSQEVVGGTPCCALAGSQAQKRALIVALAGFRGLRTTAVCMLVPSSALSLSLCRSRVSVETAKLLNSSSLIAWRVTNTIDRLRG